MRTRIKVCGITRREDALQAISLGVDALGFVFYPPSPRAVSPEQAAEISHALPAFVTQVALFMDPEPAQVDQVIQALGPNLLQFHGKETGEFCAAFGQPYIKALPMGGQDPESIDAVLHDHVAALGFLLDSHRPGEAGGTGAPFDWRRVRDDIGRPIVLAGGLKPDNVADAIRAVNPYAVDVSSGVESAPGLKDATLMRAFVQQVRNADEARNEN